MCARQERLLADQDFAASLQLTGYSGSSMFRCSLLVYHHRSNDHSMQAITDFLHRLGDPRALVAWGGYVGLTIIIFAETGLLVGFFLPGDSLLVTAGLLASQTQLFDLDVYILGILLSIASIVGNSVGYYIGRVTGPHLFTRENSLLFQ